MPKKYTDPISQVNHPPHYNWHPTGIECIDIIEHFSFNVGNAIKYLWRADAKEDWVADLQKAIWYVQRELDRAETFGEHPCHAKKVY